MIKKYYGNQLITGKVYKPLLHKKGKQWVVVGLSALMLAGLGAMNAQANHASANTNQPTASRVVSNSNVNNQAQSLHKSIQNQPVSDNNNGINKLANNNYQTYTSSNYGIKDLLNNKGYSDDNGTVTSDHLNLSDANVNQNERKVVANNGNWYGEFSDDYGERYGQLKGLSHTMKTNVEPNTTTTLSMGNRSDQARAWNFVQHGVNNSDFDTYTPSASSSTASKATSSSTANQSSKASLAPSSKTNHRVIPIASNTAKHNNHTSSASAKSGSVSSKVSSKATSAKSKASVKPSNTSKSTKSMTPSSRASTKSKSTSSASVAPTSKAKSAKSSQTSKSVVPSSKAKAKSSSTSIRPSSKASNKAKSSSVTSKASSSKAKTSSSAIRPVSQSSKATSKMSSQASSAKSSVANGSSAKSMNQEKSSESKSATSSVTSNVASNSVSSTASSSMVMPVAFNGDSVVNAPTTQSSEFSSLSNEIDKIKRDLENTENEIQEYTNEYNQLDYEHSRLNNTHKVTNKVFKHNHIIQVGRNHLIVRNQHGYFMVIKKHGKRVTVKIRAIRKYRHFVVIKGSHRNFVRMSYRGYRRLIRDLRR